MTCILTTQSTLPSTIPNLANFSDSLIPQCTSVYLPSTPNLVPASRFRKKSVKAVLGSTPYTRSILDASKRSIWLPDPGPRSSTMPWAAATRSGTMVVDSKSVNGLPVGRCQTRCRWVDVRSAGDAPGFWAGEGGGVGKGSIANGGGWSTYSMMSNTLRKLAPWYRGWASRRGR